MKPNLIGIFTLGVVICLAISPLQAQDPKVVVLQGVFQKMDWKNPAVQIHLDVQGSNGEIEHWVVVGDSLPAMLRSGLSREGVQRGESVIVCGFPSAKPGTTLEGGGIALMDGRTFYFGPAAANCRQAGASTQASTTGGKRAVANLASSVVNSPVLPFVNSPVQPFVAAPVTAFGVPPIVARGGFATSGANNENPVLIQGIIGRVDWRDPQVVLSLDAPGRDGRLTQWTVIGDPPQVMSQLGVARDALKIGESIVVCGLFRDPSRGRVPQVLNAGGIAFANGGTYYFGPSANQCRGTVGNAEASTPKPEPILNSPVQPFVTAPVTQFGVDPTRKK